MKYLLLIMLLLSTSCSIIHSIDKSTLEKYDDYYKIAEASCSNLEQKLIYITFKIETIGIMLITGISNTTSKSVYEVEYYCEQGAEGSFTVDMKEGNKDD